jgi:2-iminobutanoate/2-iminopropanoate deaminase
MGRDGIRSVATELAPRAIGPYSQAVVAGGLVFCSGQVALEPGASGKLDPGDVAAQTRRALENLRAVLAAAGSAPDQVVKTTVFLTTMDHFAGMNQVYAEFFRAHRPARATVAVAALPKGALVEIEAIALAGSAPHATG